MGVYTQPTCPLDWEYTLNPHAPYVAFRLLGKTPSQIGSIRAVAEFRLRTGQPLMSLDYVPNTIAYQNTFTDWEYTLNSHVHLHRLGVYTQPTWTFTDWELGVYTQPTCPLDWEYTLNPHAPYVALGVYTQPTCPLCNLQEEMEKTHLIRCPTGGNGEDPPNSM
ncbi:unnamed protein product [Rodentolepis nana]|uniref:Uncharacterized protein n=1 Tax=Rodentolepis nana TaxID=102285 RepID=A0A3P7RS82_RODNA|nr:unnamed protein product [Rodentolepis nana]